MLLTQWFDPEPTFKGLLFAKTLQEKGHEVEVITGFPNYPDGKIYDGYRMRWLKREDLDGVRVNRVPLYPSHDGSALKRIFNYISFFFSATLFGIFFAKKPDIIYVYHPPLTVGLAGALIGLFRKTPFVCDIQDLWPDTLRATGMISSPSALKLVGRTCNWVYGRAAHIVVLSPGFKNILIRRGVSQDKLTVIYNWCDEPALGTFPESTMDLLPKGFNIVFAGNMGHAQALSTVLDAAEIVGKVETKLNFVLVGSGVQCDSLKQEAEDRNIQNVYFVPRIPMSEVGTILNSADALLVHLRKDQLFEITIPSKTQAYMAIGKPIIMAVGGDAAKLVTAADCGLCCESQNEKALAVEALKLKNLSLSELNNLGTNARTYYERKLSLNVGSDHFIALFNSLLLKQL
ncbi:MAG: glycosyltransferase family 4 protein [Pseudomonadales bacterium]|nr:glycosyltransferase family 4 protein [Pseudomonadales bacterium]